MKDTMSKYNVEIDDYQISNDRVYYCLKIWDANFQKIFFRPYSEFRILNDFIIEKNKEFKLQLNLPDFPKRKLFGRTKNSQEDIKNRAKALQQYIQIVLNFELLHSFKIITDLLPTSKESTIFTNNSLSTEYSKNNCWPQMDQLKQTFLEKQDRINQPSEKKIKKTCQDTYQRYYFQMNHYSRKEDYVIYILTMSDMNSKTQYQFGIRYSKLKEYHILLKKRHFKNTLPKFPKNKLIGQTNKQPQFIEERQQELQKYLNLLFSIKEFVDSEPITYFLSRIKLEGIATVKDSSKQIDQVPLLPYPKESNIYCNTCENKSHV